VAVPVSEPAGMLFKQYYSSEFIYYVPAFSLTILL
jgi:hypothetical protein